MKSAYELALERSGGCLNKVSEKTKKRLAEIDRLYESKIAEARLSAENKLKRLTDQQAIDELNEGLLNEVASLKRRCENEKDAVRNGDEE